MVGSILRQGGGVKWGEVISICGLWKGCRAMFGSRKQVLGEPACHFSPPSYHPSIPPHPFLSKQHIKHLSFHSDEYGGPPSCVLGSESTCLFP